MIQVPGGWTTHFGANLVTTYPPDLGVRIRYYERLLPQPSFASIVGRALANDSAFVVHQTGAMERIVTNEGEYGAHVTLNGLREGSLAMRFVGAVFLDEFATALDAIALIPDHFAAVEQIAIDLLRFDEHHLTARPRRFFYVPPIGWHGLPSGMTANWYPQDFPKNLSNIVVPPASPITGDGSRDVEAAITQCELGLSIESQARDELVSVGGHRGTCVRLHGMRQGNPHRIYRELAVFVVGTHLYRMRLETTNAENVLDLRAQFRAVATSFRPLPTADERRMGRAFATGSSALFEHWIS